MSNTIRVSASQVKTFGECPTKWYLGKILGLREPSTPAQMFGSCFHYAVEAFIKRKGKVFQSYDEVKAWHLAELKDVAELEGNAVDPREEEKIIATKCTDQHYVIITTLLNNARQKLTLWLSDDVEIELEINGRIFGDDNYGATYLGYIDMRLINHDKKQIIVFDHKTFGSPAYNETVNTLPTNIQLCLYSHKSLEQYPGYTVIIGHIQYAKKPPHMVDSVYTPISPEQIAAGMRIYEDSSRAMLLIKSECGEDWSKSKDFVEKCPGSCESYGGCGMKPVCHQGMEPAELKKVFEGGTSKPTVSAVNLGAAIAGVSINPLAAAQAATKIIDTSPAKDTLDTATVTTGWNKELTKSVTEYVKGMESEARVHLYSGLLKIFSPNMALIQQNHRPITIQEIDPSDIENSKKKTAAEWARRICAILAGQETLDKLNEEYKAKNGHLLVFHPLPKNEVYGNFTASIAGCIEAELQVSEEVLPLGADTQGAGLTTGESPELSRIQEQEIINTGTEQVHDPEPIAKVYQEHPKVTPLSTDKPKEENVPPESYKFILVIDCTFAGLNSVPKLSQIIDPFEKQLCVEFQTRNIRMIDFKKGVNAILRYTGEIYAACQQYPMISVDTTDSVEALLLREFDKAGIQMIRSK